MTTDTRIESLETQVRTLKRLLFGVFGLVVVGGLLAVTTLQSVPDVIQAKKFELFFIQCFPACYYHTLVFRQPKLYLHLQRIVHSH